MQFTGVAPGRYQLIQGNPPRVAQLDAEDSQNVDPSLGTPAVTITGAVTNAAGARTGADGMVTLEPVDGTAGQAAMRSALNRGSFTFSPVAPGQWSLSVISGNRELPVESIGLNGRKLVGNRFTAAEQSLALTLTVEENPLRVEGFAKKDGKGVAGAMVVLVPKNRALFPGLARRDQSDSDGSFSLRDVAPGAYTIVAIENAWDDLDWSRPEVIGRYLSGGLAVIVTAGGEQRLKLDESVPVQPK